MQKMQVVSDLQYEKGPRGTSGPARRSHQGAGGMPCAGPTRCQGLVGATDDVGRWRGHGCDKPRASPKPTATNPKAKQCLRVHMHMLILRTYHGVACPRSRSQLPRCSSCLCLLAACCYTLGLSRNCVVVSSFVLRSAVRRSEGVKYRPPLPRGFLRCQPARLPSPRRESEPTAVLAGFCRH